MILVIMGVAGSGKTTIGKLLAQKLGWIFLEGDDFHPKANVDKMSQGIPLNDKDRTGWLASIAEEIKKYEKENRSAVVACSALKDSYRKILSNAAKDVKFVFLKGNYNLLEERLKSRKGHFMKPAMLKSQFETLEEPAKAIVIEIGVTPEKIVECVIHQLGISPSGGKS